jgi:hypothetical protein
MDFRVAHEPRELQRWNTIAGIKRFVAGVLITGMHRQLPPDEIDRGHHGRIVRVNPFDFGRPRFDVIDTGIRCNPVTIGSRASSLAAVGTAGFVGAGYDRRSSLINYRH